MSFLRGLDLFRKNSLYHVIYHNISGLQKSSPVYTNGFQVGQVKEIGFASDGHHLTVTFAVQGDLKLPKGTIARIESSDIMGTKSIVLNMSNDSVFHTANDTIIGDIESDLMEQVSMQVLPLKNKAEELLSSFDSVMTVVTYIFNAESRKNLIESFKNFNRTMANLQEASLKLNMSMGNILQNVSNLSDTIYSNSGQLAAILQNLATVSDNLADVDMELMFKNLTQMAQNLNEVTQKLNKPEGTAGLLVNDAELYHNLTQLSATIDELLTDIKNNPKKYVHFSAFGKKDEKNGDK
jgi:phospholipid/cholesterol/gamma-HCH transport system substrate-binding protein